MGVIADWIERYRPALEDEGFDIEALASFDADLEQVRQEYYDQGWSDGHECAVAERVQVLRELVADINAPEIVAHVVPYYKGWQVDGEWLDAWHDAVMAECDRLDGECKAYAWKEVER